jgi:hypothetical protein
LGTAESASHDAACPDSSPPARPILPEGAAARTGFPSKQKILEAGDRVLANDPR